jgi:hypothetical protein
MTPARRCCHRGVRERVPSRTFDTLVDPPAAADRGAGGARSAVAGGFGMAFGRLQLVGVA